MKCRILIVDDEPDVVELIQYNFKNAGWEVTTASDGVEALRQAKANLPDLILLDLMLPQLDGMEVCKLLRRDANTAKIPVIMLTAKAAEIDRVLGLEIGADDYITKPFSPRELVLRVKKLLLRRQGQEPAAERLQLGDLVLDIARHKVFAKGESIELTAKEFKLLHLLMERRGRVQSREKLLQDVWDYERLVDTRTVDTHMRRLRGKLGAAAKYLETVRNVGYRFAE